jgi:hypothetical protein
MFDLYISEIVVKGIIAMLLILCLVFAWLNW